MTPTRRDRFGIPHHTAGTVTELARLQGRAVAEDRCWQVEHARLRAEGRTASLLGERGLAWDRLARRVELEATARRAHDGLAPETAAFVAAFVEGVNDGLRAVGPVPELSHLGAEPGRWSPWTPLGIFLAHHLLFATFPGKLWRRHVEDTLGAEVSALLDTEGDRGSGSNAWAVGGGRTASGLPMVAGDPHRSFESPNTYQQVRLTCTDAVSTFDVAGFTFPGVPGVQHFGHAGSVAWGITNAMADYQDLFEERLRRHGDQVMAGTSDGWRPATVRREVIEVAGGDPVEVEVVITGNGPVVAGGPEAPAAFSLRTPSWVRAELGFDCLLPLLRSRTCADVEAALSRWVEPVNNLLVADVHGDVRQRVVGLVPTRPEDNRWRPVPGWDSRSSWTGWVADLPHQAVGSRGHLVTANHRMNADFATVGVEFAPPGRANRIDALLAGRDGLGPADMAEIHRDTLAGQPAALVAAIALLEGLSSEGRSLQSEIGDWDQRFEAHSTTAAAYARVRDLLVDGLATSPPFSALTGGNRYGAVFDPWFDVASEVWLSLPSLLSEQGRRLLPRLEEHLVRAVEDVAADRPGAWGPRHRYRPLHVLGMGLEEHPALAGDNDCVRCTGAVPGSDTAYRGSVARYVWDLAGFEHSGWVVPLGASGDPSSPHHHDQMAAWVDGHVFPVALVTDDGPLR